MVYLGGFEVLEVGFYPTYMRICDDNLSIARTAHHFNESLCTLLINFFKNIIEKQNGMVVCYPLKIIVLGKF